MLSQKSSDIIYTNVFYLLEQQGLTRLDAVTYLSHGNSENIDVENEQSDIDTIANCIESIITEEEEVSINDVTKEELQEFVENLPVESFGEMREYLRAIPILSHNIDYKCPHCEAEQIININGYEHFFA